MTVARLAVATTGPSELDRRAAALADFQKMIDELDAAHNDIDQLRVDLHREQDRVVMLIEERDRYRWEALKFRDKLVELATLQTNISLQCRQAEAVVSAVHEILNGETPSSEALDQLESAFTKGNNADQL